LHFSRQQRFGNKTFQTRGTAAVWQARERLDCGKFHLRLPFCHRLYTSPPAAQFLPHHPSRTGVASLLHHSTACAYGMRFTIPCGFAAHIPGARTHRAIHHRALPLPTTNVFTGRTGCRPPRQAPFWAKPGISCLCVAHAICYTLQHINFSLGSVRITSTRHAFSHQHVSGDAAQLWVCTCFAACHINWWA